MIFRNHITGSYLTGLFTSLKLMRNISIKTNIFSVFIHF